MSQPTYIDYAPEDPRDLTSGTDPATTRVADAFEALGTPMALNIANQFRRGDTTIDAFGGIDQLNEYYQGMAADVGAGRLSLLPPRFTTLPPMNELMAERIQRDKSTERGLELVTRIADGIYPGADLIDTEVDGLFEDRANLPLVGSLEGIAGRYVKPNEKAAPGSTWKLRVAGDPKFLEMTEGERLQALRELDGPGGAFRRLDPDAQVEVMRKLSDPKLREAPGDLARARMLGIPLRPATVGEVVDGIMKRAVTSLGVVGAESLTSLSGDVVAPVLRGTSNAIEFFTRTSRRLSARPSADEIRADLEENGGELSEKMKESITLLSEATGQDPRDAATMIRGYLARGADRLEQFHDQYDIHVPGPGDELIEFAISTPTMLKRLHAISGAAAPVLGRASWIAALPVDAYLQTAHLPEDVQKQAVAEAAVLSGLLRANAILSTPMQRAIGGSLVFGTMHAAREIDRAFQDPSAFNLERFAYDFGEGAATGWFFERQFGGKHLKTSLRERARKLGKAAHEIIRGQNRHAAATAFNDLAVEDKLVLSFMLPPGVRTRLAAGARDVGLGVGGGSAVGEGPPPPLSASLGRQQLANESVLRRIREGEREAAASMRYAEEGETPETRRLMGEPAAEEFTPPKRPEEPAVQFVPENLRGLADLSPEELAHSTARWISGDGTFQDLLMVEVPPPTLSFEPSEAWWRKRRASGLHVPTPDEEGKIRKLKKVGARIPADFELQPDPSNPRGFISVWEPAARQRVYRHVHQADKIIASHPRNKPQEFKFPDDPRIDEKWRGKTIYVGNHDFESFTRATNTNVSGSFRAAHDWYFDLAREIERLTSDPFQSARANALLPGYMAGGERVEITPPESQRIVNEMFAASQKNTSPANGFLGVWRTIEQAQSGVHADGTMIKNAGVAADEMRRALYGLRNYYRETSKLADFSDLMFDAMRGTPRMRYRSSAAGDPRAMQPVAVDVHVARARGWVDKTLKDSLVKQAKKLGDKDMLKRALALKKDLAGAPTDFVYEESVKFFNELSDYWKRNGFHPEVDHYPGGTQAVAWNVGSLSSLDAGAESPYDTIHAHRRYTPVEITPSDSFSGIDPKWGDLRARWDEIGRLDKRTQLEITRELGDWTVDQIANMVGVVPFGRDIQHAFNAWGPVQNAGSVLYQLGSLENAKAFAAASSWVMKQDEVWSFRLGAPNWKLGRSKDPTPEEGTGRGVAIILMAKGRSDALADETTRLKIYEDVAKSSNGLLAEGFTTLMMGDPAGNGKRTTITTIVDQEYAGESFKKVLKQLNSDPEASDIDKAVRAASRKHGVELDWGYDFAHVFKQRNDWQGNEGREAFETLASVGRSDVTKRMVGQLGPEYVRRFERLIESAEARFKDRGLTLPPVAGGSGPSARDFLRRRVHDVQEFDPDIPPVAPAYREKANPDTVYAGRVGGLHRDAAALHKLGPKAHVDPTLESGFVDMRTGNWLSREEAEQFLPGWLKEGKAGVERFGVQPRGKADASDFQILADKVREERAKSGRGKVGGGSGGIIGGGAIPPPGMGQKIRRLVMPPAGAMGRGLPVRGIKDKPRWMHSVSTLGPGEREFVETILYRSPGQQELEKRRRGTMTQEQTAKLSERLAENYGMTPEQYLAATQGTILTREQQMLLGDYYHATSEVAREAERDMIEAQRAGDLATVQHARSAIASLNSKRAKFLMTLYASRSEAGRTLGAYRDLLPKAERHARKALRMIMENEDLPEGAKQRLVDRVVNAEGDGDITRAIWDAYSPSWWEKFMEYRTAAMIGNPVTVGRNLIGNALHVAQLTAEQYVGVPVDILYGMGSFARHRGKGYWERPGQAQYWDKRSVRDLVAMHYGQAAGAIEGARYAWTLFIDPLKPNDNRSILQRIRDAEANQAGGRVQTEASPLPAVQGAKGEILRVPFRLQAMGDVFFYEIARNMKLHQLAMRNNVNVGKGVDRPRGRALLARIRDDVSVANKVPVELRDAIAKGTVKAANTTEEMAGEAHRYGLEATFRAPLGRVGQYFNTIRSDPSPLGKTIRFAVPFFATPANVAKSVAQRAPVVGWVPVKGMRNWNDISSGDRARAVDAVSRMTSGTALFMALFEAARQGFITGDADDKEQAAMMEANGTPPNSIILPGAGAWNYRGWSPGSEWFAIAGNAAARYRKDGSVPSAETIQRIGWGLARATLDQPFLMGASDLLDAIQAPEGAEGDWKRSKFIERAATSVIVPRGLAWYARSTDPIRRAYPRAPSTGKGIAMGVARDIPWLRQMTPEYVDPLGRSYETASPWLQGWVRHQSDKPVSELDSWLFNQQDPLNPDRALVPFFNTKTLGRTIDPFTLNEMLYRRADVLVPALERIMQKSKQRESTSFETRDAISEAVSATSRRVWNETIPMWELAHIGLEAKPDLVKTMTGIITSGPVKDFYVRNFKSDAEKKAFVEAIARDEIDLRETIRQQRIVPGSGEME